jgi:peptide/nickel transport system substrate-binding protein
VAGDSLWVTTRGAPSSHRGGALKLIRADARDITSLDPALWDEGSILPAQVRLLTNDGLVGHKQVGGVEGSALVANLATTLPRPTDGGMTYTFQLRSGIRYSTGQEVTPEDVRSSIERGFKMESAVHRRSFRGLVGTDACSRSPTTCRLSKGIVTDPSANTVTFHLTRPDPNFLVSLAQPTAFVVPAETPAANGHAPPNPTAIPTPSNGSSRRRWLANRPGRGGRRRPARASRLLRRPAARRPN